MIWYKFLRGESLNKPDTSTWLKRSYTKRSREDAEVITGGFKTEFGL